MPKYLMHMEQTVMFQVEIDLPHEIEGTMPEYDDLPADVQTLVDNATTDERINESHGDECFMYLERVEDADAA